MEVIRERGEQQLKQTRAILPESCSHFSTHWIRQDKGSRARVEGAAGGRGLASRGLTLTPLFNLSSLFITKQAALLSVPQMAVDSKSLYVEVESFPEKLLLLLFLRLRLRLLRLLRLP